MTLISWEAEHPEQQIWPAFIGKNHITRVTKRLVTTSSIPYEYSGDKRDTDVCSNLFLEHKNSYSASYSTSYSATPTESPISCLCSSRKPHTISFSRSHPSLFCKFHTGWGGEFRWPFSFPPFSLSLVLILKLRVLVLTFGIAEQVPMSGLLTVYFL